MIRILYKQHYMRKKLWAPEWTSVYIIILHKNLIMLAPIPVATTFFYFIIFYTKHKTHTCSASYLQSKDYHKSSIMPSRSPTFPGAYPVYVWGRELNKEDWLFERGIM